jgi:multidrug transporter EmrE-like cation transporter
MNFILGFLLSLLAQALTFIQLQGQFKFTWMKEHPFTVALMGLPISFIFIKSVKHMVAHFDGQLWPSRLVGFAAGAMIFTIMSSVWFKEPLSLKTLVCLGLALCILMIQLFWK